ncbi:hypothetical protein SAMN05216553_108445 [Lentzea fradiae]|uniref:Uncharacterized protein n=1 Tax=Lentzea fradiae TaxID=200378 RepID=A0A1G7UVS1_9PSEU|nr:hypothetical protein [Lentzea fradiae]SDG51642.1 hypothetical protein SAMN05216553_108445 [Lentzea fradiae]
MTFTYHDVRTWNSGAIESAAATVKARKHKIIGLQDELNLAFGPVYWHGNAATAAQTKLAALVDRAEHVVAEAGTVLRTLHNSADALTALRHEVENTDSAAASNQFTISAQGDVIDERPPEAQDTPESLHQRARLRAEIAEAVGRILRAAHEVDAVLNSALTKAEQAQISDGGATSLAEADVSNKTQDGHYRIGPPDRPDIKFDEDFVYDSKESTTGDHLDKAKWLTKLRGAQALGMMPDGTEMYEHYWKNTGEPKEFDYEKAYRDDSGIRQGVDSEITRAAAAAAELIRSGNTNFPMTGHASVAQPYPTTENWQKAVGGYQVWSHSNVRVEGNKVTMEITVKAEDRYNFNRGQADIATGAGDDENGRFTEIGWAKPFDTHGTITRTVTWEVGPPPAGPTGEPGEDREPRGSGRDRGPTPDNPREHR